MGRKKKFFTPYRKLFTNYRHSAKVRGYFFEIEQDFFDSVVSQPCHYCGIEEAKGIDRKDNNIGYSKDNCLPCCAVCNRAKGTLSYEEFINYARRLASWLK